MRALLLSVIVTLLFACTSCTSEHDSPRQTNPETNPESPQGIDYNLDDFNDAIQALPVTSPTAAEPLQLNATLVPTHASPGETVIAVLKIRLMPGWHYYSSVPKHSPYIESKLLLNLGQGLHTVDDWSGPDDQPMPGHAELKVQKGENSPLVFFRELVVKESDEQQIPVTVGLFYQTCSFDICLAPNEKKVDLTLKIDKTK